MLYTCIELNALRSTRNGVGNAPILCSLLLLRGCVLASRYYPSYWCFAMTINRSNSVKPTATHNPNTPLKEQLAPDPNPLTPESAV